MNLKLKVLPTAQLSVWNQFSTLPANFILYGGTAIALQLGHRESIDFDFFSALPLDREQLIKDLPLLANVTLIQPEINTLNCFVKTKFGEVKLQFLCGLNKRLARVGQPFRAKDNGIYIASLIDLFATKLHTIQARAEKKDYTDIYYLLMHGLKLSEGLGAAKAVYGSAFDINSSLKALCYFQDGDLSELETELKNYLIKAVKNIDDIPSVPLANTTISP